MKLKPCPFCGGDWKIWKDVFLFYYAECKCHLETPHFKLKRDLYHFINTRYIQKQMPVEIEINHITGDKADALMDIIEEGLSAPEPKPLKIEDLEVGKDVIAEIVYEDTIYCEPQDNILGED